MIENMRRIGNLLQRLRHTSYNTKLQQQLRFKHDAVKAHDGAQCTIFSHTNAINKSIKCLPGCCYDFLQKICMEIGRVQI